MKYRAEIDGLRALAVVPVILYHAGFQLFSGGFVGVDVFFVISGYLITSIILMDIDKGKFSLVHFYERRARRLLPALFFIMLISLPFAWLFLIPTDLKAFAQSLVAVSTFTSNILFWQESGSYFAAASELKPLLHTWSLAVEEQYYVLYPLFLMLVWQFGKSWVVAILIVLFILSLGLAQWGAYNHPIATFYLLPTRGWQLLIGVFASFYLKNHQHPSSKSINQFASILGLLLIFFSIFIYDKHTPYPSLYALVPTIGTVLVILFAVKGVLVNSLLSIKAIVGIGLISYSAYLWHVPLLVFARHQHFNELSLSVTMTLIFCTFVFAYFTWKYVENPFRNKKIFSRRSIFISSLAGSLFFVAFGLFVSNSYKNTESEMAYTLSQYPVIVAASNIDERLFVKFRTQFENLDPDLLIVGSSRIMQIGNHNSKMNSLNLGVSGASVEDHIAILDLATSKFNPKIILIGADPWLFNQNSTQLRWQALRKEYESALYKFNKGNVVVGAQNFQADRVVDKRDFSQNARFLRGKYTKDFSIDSDTPRDYKDLIRKDGSRVYNTQYTGRPQADIEREFDGWMSYAMRNFKYSEKSLELFTQLLEYYNKDYEVILILTPYHPRLFDRFIREKPIFLEIEEQYRSIAKEIGIKIIGSYNPNRFNCPIEDFFDAAHPNDICMERILMELQ